METSGVRWNTVRLTFSFTLAHILLPVFSCCSRVTSASLYIFEILKSDTYAADCGVTVLTVSTIVVISIYTLCVHVDQQPQC